MRKLVVALLVLVGLLVAADFGAAALAESAVSRQMRQQLALVDDPSVRINGFPFLTQAVSGRYGSIDVDATRISYGEFRELEVSAELTDVGAPLPMLLGSGPKSLDVGGAAGTVRVSASDVEKLVPGVEKLRIAPVDVDALARLTAGGATLTGLDPNRSALFFGTVTLLGREIDVAVVAVLDLADGQARIMARDVRLADGTALPIPAIAQQAVLSQFTVPIDAGTLPLQVLPQTFRAVDGLLEISGTATDLVLGAGGAPTG